MNDDSLYLIAEIGINHNGDLQLALDMIQAAAEAGFDAVKFQKRTIDKVYTKEFLESPRESPWGSTQRAQKEGLELSSAAYSKIDERCRFLGIDWSASAWDVESQHFLRQFDLPFNKVASAMLGNWPLLQAIADEKRLTYVSTGMSTFDEIAEVVTYFRLKECPIELLHCNSTYPMREEHANLRCIQMLRERFHLPVGYSGHEVSLIKVCVAAIALGARVLERHISMDRTMYGSDQAASIEVPALKNFVDSVRAIPAILGDGVKRLMPGEEAVRAKLRVDAAPL